MLDQPHTVYQNKRNCEFDLILDIIEKCEYLSYMMEMRQLQIVREEILQLKKRFIHFIPPKVVPQEIAILKDREHDLDSYVKNMKDMEPMAVAYLKINRQELDFVRQELQLYRHRLVLSEIISRQS